MLITFVLRELRNERTKLYCPWSISPFVDDSNPRKESSEGGEEVDDESTDESEIIITNEFQNGNIEVKVAKEVPWVDLVRSITTRYR